MSNADDVKIVLIGTYTSPHNTHTFNVAGPPYYLGFVNGVSVTIATLIPSYKITKAIKMSEDEFQFFKNEVLNKNVPWKFRGVEIPGTWSTGVSVGGKRSSCRRSSCRRSSCRRRSCRRRSCRRSSCRRGHRRTKHH